MDNELIEHKSWGKRNWKWFLPLILFVIMFIGFIGASKGGKIVAGNVVDITKVYADASLYENAFEVARKNEDVLNKLGKLEPLDKFAIFEGAVKYSNNNESVELHIRVKGAKEKGKMDVFAYRNGSKWEYEKIAVRIKNPKQTITVLEN